MRICLSPLSFVLHFLCQFMSCKNWAFGKALYPECTYFSWAEFDTSKFLFNHGKPRKSHSTVFWYAGVNFQVWIVTIYEMLTAIINVYLVHSFFMNVLSAAKSKGERVVLTFMVLGLWGFNTVQNVPKAKGLNCWAYLKVVPIFRPAAPEVIFAWIIALDLAL